MIIYLLLIVFTAYSSCSMPLKDIPFIHLKMKNESKDPYVKRVLRTKKIRQMTEKVQKLQDEKSIEHREQRSFRQTVLHYKVEQKTLGNFGIVDSPRLDTAYNNIQTQYEELIDHCDRKFIMQIIKELFEQGGISKEQANQLLQEVSGADRDLIKKLMPQFKQIKEQHLSKPKNKPKTDK